jgi:hypothetical protein
MEILLATLLDVIAFTRTKARSQTASDKSEVSNRDVRITSNSKESFSHLMGVVLILPEPKFAKNRHTFHIK